MHTGCMPSTDEIKAARKQLGESQAAFGARFGVDQSTVHRWETDGLPSRGAARVAVKNLLAGLEQSDASVTQTQEAYDGKT